MFFLFHSVLKISIHAISFHLNKFSSWTLNNRTLDEQTSGLRVIQLRRQNYGDKWQNITLHINWTSNCLPHNAEQNIMSLYCKWHICTEQNLEINKEYLHCYSC